jgi:hypothetical protein
VYKILDGKHEGKRLDWRPGCWWEDDIKSILDEQCGNASALFS